MAKKELVDYVEKHLRRGRHVKHIKRKLVHAGHPVHEIEEAVRHVLLTKPHLKRIRHKIFAGVFVLIAIFLMFIVLFTFEEKERFVEQKTESTFGHLTDEQILRVARDTDDTSGCEFLSSEIAYYACIDKYWERDDCFYELLMGEEADDCFTRLAMKKDDKIFCRKILSDDKQDVCFEHFYTPVKQAKNPELCADADCLRRFIRDFGRSEKVCASFLSADDLSKCFLNLSLTEGTTKYCDKIDTVYMQRECLFTSVVDLFALTGYCDEFSELYEESIEEPLPEEDDFPEDFLRPVNQDYYKQICFLRGAIELLAKGFYTCDDILRFADSEVSRFTFLSGIESLYLEEAKTYHQELLSGEEFSDDGMLKKMFACST